MGESQDGGEPGWGRRAPSQRRSTASQKRTRTRGRKGFRLCRNLDMRARRSDAEVGSAKRGARRGPYTEYVRIRPSGRAVSGKGPGQGVWARCRAARPPQSLWVSRPEQTWGEGARDRQHPPRSLVHGCQWDIAVNPPRLPHIPHDILPAEPSPLSTSSVISLTVSSSRPLYRQKAIRYRAFRGEALKNPTPEGLSGKKYKIREARALVQEEQRCFHGRTGLDQLLRPLSGGHGEFYPGHCRCLQDHGSRSVCGIQVLRQSIGLSTAHRCSDLLEKALEAPELGLVGLSNQGSTHAR